MLDTIETKIFPLFFLLIINENYDFYNVQYISHSATMLITLSSLSLSLLSLCICLSIEYRERKEVCAKVEDPIIVPMGFP